jgi:hypothetical protein
VSENDETFRVGHDEHGRPVRVYDMAPETVSGGGQHASREMITSLIVEKAERRLGEQLEWVVYAVDQFRAASRHHIEQQVTHYAGNVAISFKSLVEGLISGVGAIFATVQPEAEGAKWLLETAMHFLVDNLDAQLESETTPLDSAKAKLDAGVAALASHARQRQAHAISNAKPHVRQVIENGLGNVHAVSDDPGWIEDMCAYLGFPEPDENTISAPVRQHLEYEFSGLLARTVAELIDEDYANPDEAEKAGKAYEDKLYHEEGSRAWEDAYKIES